MPITSKEREDLIAKIKSKRKSESLSSTTASEENVLDEDSDIGLWDRLAVKNFGGDIGDQIKYLSSKPEYSDYNIQDYNGEIVAKKKGEEKFKKLDKSWSLNPIEILKDAGDIGFDVLSGIAESAGAAAGASSGVSTLGLGSVPLAAFGAARAAAGMEALKQTIGKAIGVRGEYEPSEMISSGALGAVPIFAFGTGLGKNFVKNAFKDDAEIAKYLKSTQNEMHYVDDKLSQESIDLAMKLKEEEQKGLLSGISDAAVGLVTGNKPEMLRTVMDYVPKPILEALKKKGAGVDPNEPYRFKDLAAIFSKNNNLGDAGAALSAHVDDTFGKAKEILYEQFDGPILEKSAKFKEIDNQQSEKLRELIMQKESGASEETLKKIFDEINVLQVEKRKYGLDAAVEAKPLGNFMAENRSNKTGVSQKVVNEVDNFIQNNFRPKKIKEQIKVVVNGKETIKTIPRSSDPLDAANEIMGYKNKVAGLPESLTKERRKGIRENFLIDPMEYKQIMRTIEDKAKDVLRYGAGLSEQEAVTFNNAQFRSKLQEVVGNMRDSLYDKTYENSTLRDQYHALSQLARDLERHLGTEQQAAKTMMNWSKPTFSSVRKKVEQFDELLTKINEEAVKKDPTKTLEPSNIAGFAKLGQAVNVYGDNSLQALSSGGTTSTSKTISGQKVFEALGHFAGLGTGVPGVAKIAQNVGGAAGATLASPRFTNKYLNTKGRIADVWDRMEQDGGLSGQAIRKGQELAKAAEEKLLQAATIRNPKIPLLGKLQGKDLPIINPLLSRSIWNVFPD